MLEFLASYRQGQYPGCLTLLILASSECLFWLVLEIGAKAWMVLANGTYSRIQKYCIVARAVSNSRMILGDECIPVLASGHTSCCRVDTNVNHRKHMLYMKMHVREISNYWIIYCQYFTHLQISENKIVSEDFPY